ncbi:MATE family efflux transporter [Thalassotalea castellviae]|uniref:MATE family efflux transporter n=1 Tax=Thalassotalea castellviae TaxID=3075612 RepID=A0ABU3A3H5_9GAMM|nr:MATE family efflux transporter [Thalassotalea sp. W431]MDT0604112.1 MATE family efflux transporter [Thalassotalea sp. W431]
MFFANKADHKQLFVLAIPMILSNITVPLLGLVDTAVIGHLDHAYYLGGSTVGAMVITCITWLCGFLRMTTTGLAAQAFGQQNASQNLLVLLRGLLVALIIGGSFILLQTPYISGAIYLSGGSDQVQFYAQQYSEIRIWGLPAALANLVLLGWLLGNHKAKMVMWILIFTNLVNLVLDVVFVLWLDWQVQGVAYATLIAEYASILLSLTLIFHHFKPIIKASVNDIKSKLLDKLALVSYFKLNRDILIRTLCLQSCFVFITFQGARLGDNVVAANAILMNFLLFISFGLDGIANAAEVMVGKAKGENNLKKLQVVFKVSLFWTLIFALVYSLFFIFWGPSIVRLISDIEAVVLYADQYLFWIMLLPLAACWSYLFDGIYIGLTQAKAMRNSMILSTFGCFFPLWWLLQSYENNGLWFAFIVFMIARGLTLAWHFTRHIWHAKALES